MDRKLLRRIQHITDIKMSRVELQRQELRRGISDGTALGEMYRAMDCGTGLSAELSVAHVARATQVIERGLTALRQQELEASARIAQLEATVRRLEDMRHERADDEARQEQERDLAEILDGLARGFKSGVSDAGEATDG